MVERLGGLSQRAQRKVHARPVVRKQALIAEGERIDPEIDHLVDGHGVARRLRHLHAVGEEVLAVHPVPDGGVTVRALGLRDLVLVVRKDVVDAAGVQIETLAEVLRAHRRTLDVPPRKPRAAAMTLSSPRSTASWRMCPTSVMFLTATTVLPKCSSVRRSQSASRYERRLPR